MHSSFQFFSAPGIYATADLAKGERSQVVSGQWSSACTMACSLLPLSINGAMDAD